MLETDSYLAGSVGCGRGEGSGLVFGLYVCLYRFIYLWIGLDLFLSFCVYIYKVQNENGE